MLIKQQLFEKLTSRVSRREQILKLLKFPARLGQSDGVNWTDFIYFAIMEIIWDFCDGLN